MLAQGVCGWMCDFGESMPLDALLPPHDGDHTPSQLHSLYPSLWGQLNKDAIHRAQKLHASGERAFPGLFPGLFPLPYNTQEGRGGGGEGLGARLLFHLHGWLQVESLRAVSVLRKTWCTSCAAGTRGVHPVRDCSGWETS